MKIIDKMHTEFRALLRSIIIIIACLALSTALMYLQTSLWFKKQQTENMTLAINQLDTMLDNVSEAAKKMAVLEGAECNADTVKHLRRLLALTPNVGNIELTSKGYVYCSSLEGKINAREEQRENDTLYLTSDIKALRGHPFIIFHLPVGEFGLYTSTDGYYIRYILGSASSLLPVVLRTQRGWMRQDGTILYTHFADRQNIEIPSARYPYMLSSNVDREAVVQASWKYNKPLLFIAVFLSFAVGVLYFCWTRRADTPDKLLKNALQKKELKPYLQPIVKGTDARLVGCEVLVRWLQKNTVIPPDQFIPVAEQSGLVIPMTRQLIIDVTDTFLHDFKPGRPFYISFNVSARHLQSPDIFDDFNYLLARVDKNITLAIEITEREIVSQDVQVNLNIQKLRQHGVIFALDDFGTGYSSLELLQRMDVSLIKIDKLFTSGIGSNTLYNNIIENIVDLARRIGAGIIVEGVETPDQVQFLSQLGDIAFQGYLFSKPLPIEHFKERIRLKSPWYSGA